MHRRLLMMIGVVVTMSHPGVARGVVDEPVAKSPAAREGLVRKVKLLHVRVIGDLDNSRMVKDFAAAIGDPRGDDVGLVIVELGGDRWRTDVLAKMINVCEATKLLVRSGGSGEESEAEARRPRWVVWLNDAEERRVGSGAAALALVAERAYVSPRLEVIHEPGDDARKLAPAETDWPGVEQEVRGAVWSRLSAAKGELLLSAAVPTPMQPLWVVPRKADEAGPKLKVVDAEPAGGGGVKLTMPIVGDAEGCLRMRVGTEMLVELGIAHGQAREIGQILAAERVTAKQTVRREVKSGLSDARSRLSEDFAAMDACRDRIDDMLDDAERARGHDVVRRRARAGEAATTMCDDATRRLMACEKRMEEYPELLRTVVPGQTSVGLQEERKPLEWKLAFQARRQSLAELRARAGRLKS